MNNMTICLAVHARDALYPLETFISAHLERLPALVKVVYGGAILRNAVGEPLGSSLKPFLLAHQIDAVLAEYGHTGIRVMEACAEAHVPLIVHFHGIDGYCQDILDRYGSQYQRLFSLASAIVSPSHAMEEQLIRLGAPREKVFYSPCGVDVSFFCGAEPEHAPPLFVAVGRFVEKKAPHLTMMAFKRTLDQVPDAHLVMIGDGPMLDDCLKLSRMLRIKDEVEFRGVCSQGEIAATLRQARAFVQHSIRAPDGDSESSPVSIKEAGASGLPVVSTRHAGIPEIVVHGETGYLVEERNIDAMAHYMIRLAEDPTLAGRLGGAAARRISAHFSMETTIENLWRIIRQTIPKVATPTTPDLGGETPEGEG